MDVLGTLIWIGILINPFLAYQTKNVSLYRITLISFTVFLATWMGIRGDGRCGRTLL
ncbi:MULTISPECIES: hypothetical protein [unclassified Exiguobacterium]|uniref:hypothetical protein n=1 Tax=unclassified Exiguobacterium TaxID=2644629 RepID=UPI001BE50DB2|nr:MULTISPECIES: hypothetical protein [unclassified Exiguobacterium]